MRGTHTERRRSKMTLDSYSLEPKGILKLRFYVSYILYLLSNFSCYLIFFCFSTIWIVTFHLIFLKCNVLHCNLISFCFLAILIVTFCGFVYNGNWNRSFTTRSGASILLRCMVFTNTVTCFSVYNNCIMTDLKLSCKEANFVNRRTVVEPLVQRTPLYYGDFTRSKTPTNSTSIILTPL